METTNTGEHIPYLDADEIRKSFAAVEALRIEQRIPHHIEHHGAKDFFKNLAKEVYKVNVLSVAEIYGIPIYERPHVPYGEIWLCDNHGRPLTKFRFLPPTNV